MKKGWVSYIIFSSCSATLVALDGDCRDERNEVFRAKCFAWHNCLYLSGWKPWVWLGRESGRIDLIAVQKRSVFSVRQFLVWKDNAVIFCKRNRIDESCSQVVTGLYDFKRRKRCMILLFQPKEETILRPRFAVFHVIQSGGLT